MDRVLSAADYWNIDDSPESDWLRVGVLPKVRVFLEEHREHAIRYVDEEWIYGREESGDSWLEVETWCKNAQQ